MIKAYLVAWMLAAGPVAAEDFDYYVLALSWTPSFCASGGADGDADAPGGQCDPDRDLGFTLHGLWPQWDAGGWPEYCETDARDPSRRETAAMADIMGSGGLAWYQWKKHGRCAGLEAGRYFRLSRALYQALDLSVPTARRLSAAELEEAFRAANPDFPPDSVIVTCRARAIREIRLCIGTDLEPRPCGRDVLADACRSGGPQEFPPVP